MVVYRIAHRNYSKELIATGIKGRWNSVGKKVIYCSESIPLAFLENMVRRQGVGFNNDFKIMLIDIPEVLAINTILPIDLKDGWRDFTDYSKCQPLGNQWYDENAFCILKVPSAVLPDAYNYVLNTIHQDFKKIKLIGVTDLAPDKRIEDILKKYNKG